MSRPHIPPELSTEQMAEVDRLMIEEYGISLLQMMENAGRNLAELTRRLLGGSVEDAHVGVFAGAGNNGGGGLVAARHLSNWGAQVTVTLVKPPDQLKDVPAQQFNALRHLPIEWAVTERGYPAVLNETDAIIDAIIGYGLSGDPRGPAADLIRHIRDTEILTIALDVPSGLDATAGIPHDPCIVADATLTLALPKVGLSQDQAQEVVGDLYLADISVPPALYEQLGISVPNLFETSSLILLPDSEYYTEDDLIEMAVDHFDEKIEAMIKLAEAEAKRGRSKYVSSGHLLLALLQDEEGLAGHALHSAGVHLELAREIVRVRMYRYRTGPFAIFSRPSLSHRVDKVLQRAIHEAFRQGRQRVSTEHLLLALLNNSRGMAMKVLDEMSISRDQIRKELENSRETLS